MTTIVQRSIRSRLRKVMMWISTTVIALACIGFAGSDLLDESNQLNHELSMLAEVIGSNSVAALMFGDKQAAGEVLSALRTKPSVLGGCLYTREGAPFAVYSTRSDLVMPRAPRADGLTRTGGHLELFRPITIENERIGTIYIVSDLRDLFAQFVRYGIIVSTIFLVALIAAFTLSSRLARVISDPIVELASVAERVSTVKDYAVRVTKRASSDAEVEFLVDGFNSMLAEIERRDDELEQKVELRTSELREANRDNELILDSIADGVQGFDLSGKFMFANPASLRLLGRTGEELTGLPAHETIHHSRVDGSLYPRTECPIYTTLKDGIERQVNGEVLWRRDGTSFPVDYLIAPMLNGDGVLTGATFTFRDITERRAIEKMKDEFVSTVSHELRTPLTSIRGALGLLSSGMLGAIAPKGQRMLEIAVSNTDRLVRLINDILDLERIASGKIELSRAFASANDLMTAAAEGVQSMAQAAGVEIVVEPLEGSVWIDSDRIMQTVTNLLSNAIKFSPRGATVRISGSEKHGTFTFAVADDGRGVPQDKLDTIFERFKQVDASDSRDKGGSGLGLAICRSIVNAHGGRIWAESGEKGSLFQFTIPPGPVFASADRPKLVLLCADERSALAAMTLTLQNHGFEVVSETSAAEVSVRAAELRPDAIVLNVASNNGEGWAIVQSLKENEQTRETPIIVIAVDGPESGDGHASAIARWVHHPFVTEDLIQAVEVACDRPAILIVEDDLDLARVMTESLQAQGIRTIHAATGFDAVSLCQQHKPTLIVLDLMLPGMDGFAVVKSLRADSTLANVPLLVYSAMEVATAEQARLKLGPTEFLTKSRCSLQEFESHVVRLLETVTSQTEEDKHAA